MSNPAAAENNLHHTRTYWSDREEQEEWERDHGEVDKNGCYPGEPITHDYPPDRQSATMLDNESNSEECPF